MRSSGSRSVITRIFGSDVRIEKGIDVERRAQGSQGEAEDGPEYLHTDHDSWTETIRFIHLLWAYSGILWDVVGYWRILLMYIVGYWGILLRDMEGYGRILRDIEGYCGILRDIMGYCGISLRDIMGYEGILRDIKGNWEILWDIMGYYGILLRDMEGNG